GILCGVLGSFIVLRREALLGDGIAHSSYPGIMLAFMFLGVKSLDGLLLGAFISALVATGLILMARQYTRLPFDGVLASVLSGFFGAGLVLAAIIQHSGNANQAGLNQFIFGQASTILYRDVILTTSLSLIVLLLVVLFWKELKLMAFDPDYAGALGLPGGKLNVLLSFLTMMTVLLSIQAVGIILMSAMLIAPSVAARQWTRRLEPMVLLSALFGAVSSATGTIASSSISKMPTGPAIVVAASVIVITSLLFAPRRGLVSQYLHHKRLAAPAKKGGVL
ncbi:MAG: iron chelate uptake ABC transporter family permease subunit, partial [Dialister sp.]|nr:iron chelate uptake ABC transporter family permease subunit [Dialister sp.]